MTTLDLLKLDRIEETGSGNVIRYVLRFKLNYYILDKNVDKQLIAGYGLYNSFVNGGNCKKFLENL